jgi:aspartate/methionine/tyrosine aminotransferase
MISPSLRTTNFHYSIRDLVSTAEAQEQSGRKVVYLNIGDPQAFGFQPPNHLVEAVARALRDGFTGYVHSAGLPAARSAVAAFATELGAPTNFDEVLITAGASEAADLILTALVNPGDEVLLPAPGYPLYSALLNKLDGIPRYYPLDNNSGWQPAVSELGSLISKRTRAVVLINPNNPTGSLIADELTKQILELAARHKLLVIADEVYRELCFDKRPTPTSILAQEFEVPVITLESLSKSHLVPGWRVGWMRYTHWEHMRELSQAIGRLAAGRLCSPTPAQYAVAPALEGSREFQTQFLSKIKLKRDLCVERIRNSKLLTCEQPGAAFYLMVRSGNTGGSTDEAFVLDLLKKTGVLVVPGSGFGMDPRQGYFRMVYLAAMTTLEEILDGIETFVTSG